MILREFKVWGGKREENDSLYIWAKDADDAIEIARLTDQSICISQWTGNEKSYEETIKLVKEVTGMSLDWDDAISRQAVVEYIKASDADLGHDSENEFAVEDILNMPPVTPTQKWIPVSERLPNIGETVLCQCQVNIYEVLKLTVDGWYHDNEHCYMEGFVIAWQPLPQPYKAESEDKE